MKKLILMTSALTLVGGTAFAASHAGGEIDISAEVSVTYGDWDARAGGEGFDFSTSLTAALEGTSGGVTYGGSITVENADTVADAVTLDIIYFSGGFGKFSFAQDEWDVITDEVGDVQYEGTFGDISTTLTADADSDEWLAEFGYAGAGFNLGLTTDSDSLTELSADVEVGNFTIGASADTDEAWGLWVATDLGGINTKVTYDVDAAGMDVTGLEIGGSTGDVTWELTANTDDETTADISVAFGDASVTIAHDSTNAGGTGDDAENVLMFEYGMNNLTFHVNVNDADEYEVGATAGFNF